MKCVACLIVVCQLALTKYCVLADSGGPSARLLNFASTLSGHYSNSAQVWTDRAHNKYSVHDNIEVNVVPVDIPALDSDITLYLLEKDNGRVVRKLLCVITENDEGVFILTPYNFTDRSRFGNTVPDPADLADIKPEDLINPPKECEVTFQEVDEGVYTGIWPDCRTKTVNGQYMTYVITLTCRTWAAEVNWKKELETANALPYIINTVKRFPLTAAMTEGATDWSPPCRKL